MARPQSAFTYIAVRLHHRDENAWAVVANESGAILVEGKRLMMRLSHEDALRIADAASCGLGAQLSAYSALRH